VLSESKRLSERLPVLQVAGTRVRLYGVDAPESAQSCKDSAGRDYACGKPCHRARGVVTERTCACAPTFTPAEHVPRVCLVTATGV